MNILIKKPILVAGISLSFLLWLGQKLTNYWDQMGNISILGLICLGGLSLVLRKLGKKEKKASYPSLVEIAIEDLTKKITIIKNQIQSLVSEAKISEIEENPETKYTHFQQELTVIENSFPRENIDIVLLNLSQKTDGFNLHQNLEKIFSKSIKFSLISDFIDNFNHHELSSNWNQLILDYDLLILIVNEDLTQSQKDIIIQCKNHQQNLLVVFDDINYTLQEEKKLIFNSIKKALDSLIDEKYILSISSKKQTIKVRKYEDENQYQEWEEINNVNEENLINTFRILIENEQEKLILSTAYRNAINLEKQVRKELNLIRRNKSLKVIEKYQIVAATATFANPVSSLDLLATAAINAQMIVDLSKIYQHPLSLSQAQQISLALAKVMLKLGIVEISTQTISAILKTNMITFVAGGLIQGISAAYLTRLCALSLIEYYETTELTLNDGINVNKIKEKIQTIFEQNKTNNFFDQFVKKTSLLLA